MDVGRFGDCLHFVLTEEGGFTDNPNDRGGATNCGITQRVYDVWCIEQQLPQASVRDILPDEVEGIYRANYWGPVHAASLAPPLDLIMFDSAVQHGVTRAILLLQKAVGVEADGNFGPITQNAVAGRPAALVAHSLMEQRYAYYQWIVDHDPSQQRFVNGWNNRMQALAQAAALT